MGATREQAGRADALIMSAGAAIDRGAPADFLQASEQIDQLHRYFWWHGLDQDGFVRQHFDLERGNRHLATDHDAYDRMVGEGTRALAAGDMAAVRRAFIGIVKDQVVTGPRTDVHRASLLKA